MSNTFIVSDTHWGHHGVVKFLREDGSKLRPWDTIEEMDEAMVENWNSVVRPKDKVYHLGDVVINRRAFPTLARLNGDKVLIKGNHDCLDEQTECLTKNGWTSYQNLSDNDLVYSINPTNNLGEWKPILARIYKNHNGPVWELSKERMSMVVTENHRVMYRNTETGNIKYSAPEDIKGLMYLQTSAINSLPDVNISDAYLKAMAWYYTDGCLTKHKGENRAICFYQSKLVGMLQLESVLKDADISYVKSSEGITPAGSDVVGKRLVKDSLEAFIYRVSVDQSKCLLNYVHKERHTLPEWIYDVSVRQASLFVKELINGDGSWATNGNSNSAVLYGNLRFLEQVQRLCVTSGINANISMFRESDYRLNINFSKTTKVYSTSSCKKSGEWCKRHYTGIVWCISTEHTNFMVRRKGQTFFTGNCFKLHEYTPYFRDIRGFGALDGFALTHVPIHPDSLSRWKGNLHGHLHANRVMKGNDQCVNGYYKVGEIIDPRYLCLSVEHINFTPISLEDAKKRFEEQQ